MVRQAVGYQRYDTTEELALLNEIYALLRLHTNFFSPAAEARREDPRGRQGDQALRPAWTSHQRILTDKCITKKIKTGLGRQYGILNPAQLRQNILTLGNQLLDLVKAKHQPTRLPANPPAPTHASSREATTRRRRAS